MNAFLLSSTIAISNKFALSIEINQISNKTKYILFSNRFSLFSLLRPSSCIISIKLTYEQNIHRMHISPGRHLPLLQ